MTRYAQSTNVSSSASRDEIERTLRRYGATGFMYGWDDNRAALGFVLRGRQIRFVIPMPNPEDRQYTHTPAKGMERTPDEAFRQYDQAVRASWRSLLLVIKAKLEAVDAGIVSFEDEFLARIVLPNNRTVGEEVVQRVIAAIDTGTVPRLLPALEA